MTLGLLTAVIPEGLQKPGGISVTSTHLLLALATIVLVGVVIWFTARRR